MIIAEDYVTSLAKTLGWTLDNVSVLAKIFPDGYTTTDDAECYGAASIEAWKRGQWRYVAVTVEVIDSYGHTWGSADLNGVEYGAFPATDEQGNVTRVLKLDPLQDSTDPDVLYPLPDLIAEALADAQEKIAAFILPRITRPKKDAS